VLTDREEALQQDVSAEASPQRLAARARALGMVPNENPAFIRVADGRVLGVPKPAKAPPKPKPKPKPKPTTAAPSTSATGAQTKPATGAQTKPAAGAQATVAATQTGGAR
jgi:hypothetical protein